MEWKNVSKEATLNTDDATIMEWIRGVVSKIVPGADRETKKEVPVDIVVKRSSDESYVPVLWVFYDNEWIATLSGQEAAMFMVELDGALDRKDAGVGSD